MEVKDIQKLLADMKLANLARALCAGVRDVSESDSETLKRIFKEYSDCKYRDIPIPDLKDEF